MRTITIFITLIALTGSLYAESSTSIDERIFSLKEKIKSYWEDMPQLSWRQKAKIGLTLRGHRSEIRSTVDELRVHVIAARKEYREVLTHEQLLKALAFKDELTLRPKGEKIAIILGRMEKNNRMELVRLAKNVWRAEEGQIEYHIDELHRFKMEKLFPNMAAKLELTVTQQQSIREIIEKYKVKIRPLAVKLISQIRLAKEAAKSKLSNAQIDFLQKNRSKIEQEITSFIEGL